MLEPHRAVPGAVFHKNVSGMTTSEAEICPSTNRKTMRMTCSETLVQLPTAFIISNGAGTSSFFVHFRAPVGIQRVRSRLCADAKPDAKVFSSYKIPTSKESQYGKDSFWIMIALRSHSVSINLVTPSHSVYINHPHIRYMWPCSERERLF